MVSGQVNRVAAQTGWQCGGFDGFAVQFQVRNSNKAAVAAAGEQAIPFDEEQRPGIIGLPSAGVGTDIGTEAVQDTQMSAGQCAKSAGIGWRNGADQVVHLAGRAGPVDAAVFRLAAAEIAAVA